MATKAGATASNEPTEWTILYHVPGKMKGRGEFLRLMLEDQGVSYDDTDKDLYGPNGMMDAFRGAPEAVKGQVPSVSFPLLFPPAIWHRPKNCEEVMVNQAGASMIYLGDQLGYAPTTSAERARANAVLMNVMDYIAEGRRTFHPIEDKKSYKDQKEEGDKASKEWTKSRMKIFLYHFEKTVAIKGGKAPVAGGQNLTYADFALFHVLDATVSQFNTEYYDYAWDHLDVPKLKEYYDWMKTRPNLQAYFKSVRVSAPRINPYWKGWPDLYVGFILIFIS